MKRLLPVLMGFVVLLLSSTEGWSLPPCPGSPTDNWHIRGNWTGCFGTLIFSDRGKYVGEWKDRKRHGQGTMTYADGRVKEGIWENGEFLYARKLSPTVTAKNSSSEDLRSRLLLIKRLESEGLITKEEAASKRRSILGLSSTDEQDAKPLVTAKKTTTYNPEQGRPVKLAVPPPPSANNAYAGEGDINTKCSPDSSIPNVNIKYVGAYFSLSNFNRKTELAKAQIIPYFYEFEDEVFTLRLSDKKRLADKKKYRHAKGVLEYSQGALRKFLRNVPISKYLVNKRKVNIRSGPGSRHRLTAKPLAKGTEIIGRGSFRGGDGRKWLQVIYNEEVIGYSASRLFKKLQDITHLPTYNLDCRRDNLEEKFRNSAKAFPQFDVRFISPPP